MEVKIRKVKSFSLQLRYAHIYIYTWIFKKQNLFVNRKCNAYTYIHTFKVNDDKCLFVRNKGEKETICKIIMNFSSIVIKRPIGNEHRCYRWYRWHWWHRWKCGHRCLLLIKRVHQKSSQICCSVILLKMNSYLIPL